jgi:hypothetical protein
MHPTRFPYLSVQRKTAMTRLKLLLAGLLLAGSLGCLPGKSDESPEPSNADKARLERVSARDAALKAHHDRCESMFVKASGFGGGRMPVLSHQSPDYPLSLHLSTAEQGDDLAAPWHMEKVELVSLLNNPGNPGVYEAQGMGRMLFVRPKTRELDGFESQALAYLQAGEKMMVSEAAGHVRALGAIRMRADCKGCHDKPEGTLLGAFTYSFKPGPAPAKPAAVPPAPAPVPVPRP